VVDTIYVYECDRCGYRVIVGRTGESQQNPWPDFEQHEETGERCRGHMVFRERRPLGSIDDMDPSGV
jgi:hypothetical protein